MRSKNKEIRDHHAKMYIDAVFGDTLKQEGFISPDDKSFSWFRVVNNELVHAVYFHATWPELPLMGLMIESKVFPLFVSLTIIPPYIPVSPIGILVTASCQLRICQMRTVTHAWRLIAVRFKLWPVQVENVDCIHWKRMCFLGSEKP